MCKSKKKEGKEQRNAKKNVMGSNTQPQKLLTPLEILAWTQTGGVISHQAPQHQP
jgi:hypothetical protein